jgi:predicted ATPase
MLNKLELHNFKSHHDTRINFDDSRLQAIVGQNSAGKTSILQAIHLFAEIANTTFKDVFVFQNNPDFIITIGEKQMSVTANGCEGSKPWEVSYGFKKEYNYWTPIPSWHDSRLTARDDMWFSSLNNTVEKEVLQTFQSGIYIKLSSTNFTKAAYSEAITPEVQFDGSGLAPTLDYLRSEAPDRFESIQEMLQQIVPGVRKVGVRRAKVKIDRQRSIEVDGKSISYEENQEVTGQEIVLDMNTGDRIPAHAISEGTMLTLGLLTVLMNPKQPNLVLLDDIE